MEILACSQGYSFLEDCLIQLASNIKVHTVAFLLLYKKKEGNTITPKLHALLHLPRQIKMFGPLRYTSCWRYEAKDAPCTKITHRNCNFKNVPLTIAKHIQQLSGLNAKIDRHSKMFGEFSPWAKICDSSSHLPFKLQDSNWADLVRSCGAEINNCSLFSIAKRVKVSGNFLPRHCFT